MNMTTLASLQHERLSRLFPWERLDRDKALARPDLLNLVREACLIESYFAVYTARMMRLLWYDVTATSILSIEAFEAYVHFATLRRYLEEVGYRPVSDDEIRQLREKDLDETADDELQELVNFMVTEHFAAHFFRDLANETDEPVLKAIMERFSPEEDLHADLAGELIRARVAGRDDLAEKVVRGARSFRHIGMYVLPGVSNVRSDVVDAILALDRKIEALVGRSMIEPAAESNPA